MPNHFHLMIFANEKSVEYLKKSNMPMQRLSESIRMLLSSYTKAINNRYKRKGNLFQQRTKSKDLYVAEHNYIEKAFHYIHQNPVKAGLVKEIRDWEFSSYRDFAGLRNGDLCNKELAVEILGMNPDEFEKYSSAFGCRE